MNDNKTKKRFGWLMAVVALVALALVAILPTRADDLRNVGADTVLSYTAGSGSYFSASGTNNELGYTNSVKVKAVGDGTTVNLFLHYASLDANTNVVTIYARPAYGSGANDVATTGQSWRIAVTAAAVAGATVSTNLTSVGAPYLWLQVEQPADVSQITNLTLRYKVKTP